MKKITTTNDQFQILLDLSPKKKPATKITTMQSVIIDFSHTNVRLSACKVSFYIHCFDQRANQNLNDHITSPRARISLHGHLFITTNTNGLFLLLPTKLLAISFWAAIGCVCVRARHSICRIRLSEFHLNIS